MTESGTVEISAFGGSSRYEMDEDGLDRIFQICEVLGSRLDLDNIEESLPALWCGRIQRRCPGGLCSDCHLYPGSG